MRLARSVLALVIVLATSCSDESADMDSAVGAGGDDGGGSFAGANGGGMSGTTAGTPGAGAPSAGGGGSQAGSGAGASGGAAAPVEDAGTPAPPAEVPICDTPPGSCPARSTGLWEALLEAAELGVGARLVATGGQGVLVALGEGGGFRAVRLRSPSADASAPAYTVWDLPSSELEPIAIAEGRLSDLAPPPPETMFVLACDGDRTHCVVWRSDVTAPEAWETIEVPSGYSPRGISIDGGTDPHGACVYGAGMVCLSEDWQPAIAADTELTLRDVAFGAQWSLAVGDRGRWFKREADAAGALGAFQEQASLGEVGLTQASVAGEGGVITGEGRLLAVVGEQTPHYACGPEGELAAVVLSPAVAGVGYAVTRQGDVVQHALVTPQRPEAYCSYQQLSVQAGVLSVGSAPCAAALNPRVLTEQTLFGTSQCLTL